MAELLRDTRASIALMTALLLLALCGFAALAVDVGVWEVNVMKIQGAADQAALGAAIALPLGVVVAQAEGKGVAALMDYKHGTNSVAVTVNVPPLSGAYAGNKQATEVIITQQQTMYLSGLFLATPPIASGRAVAGPSPAYTCIMALSPTGSGLVNVGLNVINAPNCNIYVNSTSPCDVALVGATLISAYDIYLGTPACALGLASITATDKLTIGGPPAADPYASRIIPTPASPCKTVNTFLKLAIALTPGTYCGISALLDLTVTLSPGVYIFTGDVSALGLLTINGTGVTMVFTTGNGSTYAGLSALGIMTLNLTPMTNGPTAGMALWFDALGAKPFSVIGGSILTLTGAFYAPASNVTITSIGFSSCTQLIANTIDFLGVTGAGTSTYQHNCGGLGTADVLGAYQLVE